MIAFPQGMRPRVVPKTLLLKPFDPVEAEFSSPIFKIAQSFFPNISSNSAYRDPCVEKGVSPLPCINIFSFLQSILRIPLHVDLTLQHFKMISQFGMWSKIPPSPPKKTAAFISNLPL